MRLVAILSVSTLWLLLASAAASQELTGQISQREQAFQRAILAQGEGLPTLLAPGFIYNTLVGSQLNGQQTIAQLQSGRVQLDSLEHSCMQVMSAERAATVTAVARAQVTVGGQQRLVYSRYLHVWQWQADNWYLQARQVTRIDSAELLQDCR